MMGKGAKGQYAAKRRLKSDGKGAKGHLKSEEGKGAVRREGGGQESQRTTRHVATSNQGKPYKDINGQLFPPSTFPPPPY